MKWIGTRIERFDCIMKKTRWILVLLFACLIVGGIAFYSYFKPRLSDTNLVIYTGYSKTISVRGWVEQEEWYSLDPKIATVENGKITAHREGETDIYVDIGKREFVCRLTVKKAMSPIYYDIARKEKEWIFSEQLDNGALPLRRGKDNQVVINPYFACVSMSNVLHCEPDDEEIAKVRSYILWHFSHINEMDNLGVVGTIYDYRATINDNGEILEETDETYDSSDSYAAVFLILLKDYCEISGDDAIVIQNQHLVDMVYSAMTATLVEGYTFSKMNYKITYLMDNVEVRCGLDAAHSLYTDIIKDINMESEIESIIKEFDDGFEDVWWEQNHYHPYLPQKRTAVAFDWNNFYVDAVSQIYTIIYLETKGHQREVYESFCDNWEWEKLSFMDGKESFYWGALCYAALKMEDIERVQTYIEHYLEETKGRKYPLIASDASFVARAGYGLAQYYKKIEEE